MKRWKPARFLFSPRTWTPATPAGTKFNFNYDDDTNMFENGWTEFNEGACSFVVQSNKGYFTIPSTSSDTFALIDLADAEDGYESISFKITVPPTGSIPIIRFGTLTMLGSGAAYVVLIPSQGNMGVLHLDGLTFHNIVVDLTVERTVEIIRVSDTTFDVKVDDTTYPTEEGHFTVIGGGLLGDFTAADKILAIGVTNNLPANGALYVDDLVAAWAS
jgi:hypothetical protein